MNRFQTCRNALQAALYDDGRLLERRIFDWLCNDGDEEGVLRAIMSYQNGDGGFGHGIEPDLMTPSSTMIASETALVLIDLLGITEKHATQGVAYWVCNHLDERGTIANPPKDLEDYPHQPWWKNEDDKRILFLSGQLMKMDHPLPAACEEKVAVLAEGYMKEFLETEEPMTFYDYPLYVYALNHPESPQSHEVISAMEKNFPFFFSEYANHYPLFSRYWYHAMDRMPEEFVEHEMKTLQETLTQGRLPNPYPELTQWDNVFTLDALLVLNKYGLTNID